MKARRKVPQCTQFLKAVLLIELIIVLAIGRIFCQTLILVHSFRLIRCHRFHNLCIRHICRHNMVVLISVVKILSFQDPYQDIHLLFLTHPHSILLRSIHNLLSFLATQCTLPIRSRQQDAVHAAKIHSQIQDIHQMAAICLS